MCLLGGTVARSWVRLGIAEGLAFMFSMAFLYNVSAGCLPPTLSVLEGWVSMLLLLNLPWLMRNFSQLQLMESQGWRQWGQLDCWEILPESLLEGHWSIEIFRLFFRNCTRGVDRNWNFLTGTFTSAKVVTVLKVSLLCPSLFPVVVVFVMLSVGFFCGCWSSVPCLMSCVLDFSGSPTTPICAQHWSTCGSGNISHRRTPSL